MHAELPWNQSESLDTGRSADPHSGFIPLKDDVAAQLLAHVLKGAKAEGALVVFDLDSTLLDNAPRQSLILREYGESVGQPQLADSKPEHWEGWSFEVAMVNAGLRADEAARHKIPFRKFWSDRFFTSAYCPHDVEIPGARRFARGVHDAGASVVYVTGRQETMRKGTRKSFSLLGFPDTDEERVTLIMKPTRRSDDDAYKVGVNETLKTMGQVIAAFDNEPTHINGYREGFPEATVVHMATDHSTRPVKLLPFVPSIRDFSALR